MSAARLTLEVPATSLATGEDFDVCLAFDLADPWALVLECADASWVVERNLFLASFVEPQGEGRVHLEPLEGFPPRIAVRLEGPAAPAPFSLPAEPVWGFLAQVWRAVPDGEELRFVDVEAELRRISGS